MADYRLSAKVISRGNGQSSVASSAYRAGCQLTDERTGVTHDYTRKGGIVHSEILAPVNAPDWMRDRAQLWNAVEKVEARKNSQLSREIQLSLPHELNHAQRVELVQGFVQGQFVSKGMIADVNIHAPDKNGDQRNHHAHIMLTVREVVSEGFHAKKATPKARSWNDNEQLVVWRKEWAHSQNAALKKNGYDARVSAESYATQGIDREPQHHLGTAASDMVLNGKKSRIQEQNNRIKRQNARRATNHARAAQRAVAMSDKTPLNTIWAKQKTRQLEDAHRLADLDLSQKHDRQMGQLEGELEKIYPRKTIQAEINAIDRRLSATGLRATARNIFGRTARDQTAKTNLSKTLNDAHNRMEYERAKLRATQQEESQKLAAKTDTKIKKIREQEEANKRGGRPNTTRRRTNTDMLGQYERRDLEKAPSHIAKTWADTTAKPVEPDGRKTIEKLHKTMVTERQFKKTAVEITTPPKRPQAQQMAQNWAVSASPTPKTIAPKLTLAEARNAAREKLDRQEKAEPQLTPPRSPKKGLDL
ncbi:MAG: MobQ family relaxase [Nitrospirota bacterium]|nr:MobQ family relaxase [Nitrospirota bacterium]